MNGESNPLCCNSSCSLALLLLPPSDHSTVQYPWLTHGTNPSPQHLLAYTKPRKLECAGNSLPPAWAPADPGPYTQSLSQQHGDSPALTLEGSNWEVSDPVRLIFLNSTDLGKNWKNISNLACDCTFCYTHWAGVKGLASKFLWAPGCWKLEPCFFLGKVGNSCSAQYRLSFAYKKLPFHHLDSKYSLPWPAKKPNSQKNKEFCCSHSPYPLLFRQFGFPNKAEETQVIEVDLLQLSDQKERHEKWMQVSYTVLKLCSELEKLHC